MDLIDIGLNLTNRRYNRDRDAVIQRAVDAGVGRMIVTGTSEQASLKAASLTWEHPGLLFATAGVHPHDAAHWHEATPDLIGALATRPEVVAIGECGGTGSRLEWRNCGSRACGRGS